MANPVNSMYYQPQQSQSAVRLKSGLVFAGLSTAISGGVLLGDKYCPNATHKTISLLNFSTPDEKEITEPVFKKFSTGTKAKTVLGIALLTGVLGALFCKPKNE